MSEFHECFFSFCFYSRYLSIRACTFISISLTQNLSDLNHIREGAFHSAEEKETADENAYCHDEAQGQLQA